ncbi:hypothetical protein ACH4Q7_22455 [Streptomyces roseolus]|uniref:hypothetical protein n=1 Tax=Streptomyces roseolus TaxID=67358 RepID=UPI00378B3E26
MPELDTPAEVREFLRLCLRTRTINELATVMPDWLAQAISNNDPRLASLRRSIAEAEAALADARARYVTVLDAWIEDTVDGPATAEEGAGLSDDPRALARVNRPASGYLRSGSGMLHLRRSGPEDDGLSYHYARCGWYTDLGREAVPLTVGSDPRVCRRCEVIEP